MHSLPKPGTKHRLTNLQWLPLTNNYASTFIATYPATLQETYQTRTSEWELSVRDVILRSDGETGSRA
jgi:hypothetical protein